VHLGHMPWTLTKEEEEHTKNIYPVTEHDHAIFFLR
jgi:hypothetical protein